MSCPVDDFRPHRVLPPKLWTTILMVFLIFPVLAIPFIGWVAGPAAVWMQISQYMAAARDAKAPFGTFYGE